MSIYILVIIAVYFGILLFISLVVSKKNNDNDAFFRGNRQSPWYVVAIGMVGASISGVTFVSVPRMVRSLDMTYMQMVFGFILGYFFVAYVLLPLYYKLNLTSIYEYLRERFGFYSYKSGAVFFILSKIVGAAARLYLVAIILQALVFDQWNIPFFVTVIGIILLIWIYTYRSGIKTIVWTDTLQTLAMIITLILIIWQVSVRLDLDFSGVISTVGNSEHFRIFVFDDWVSKQNFFKQFFSGILIVIVMTGLDQDMMQKNLTCKTLADAKKNMIVYGFAFTPINFLFLSLGVLLLLFASRFGIELPSNGDNILPMLASQYLGLPVLIFFTIGIIAAAFSSADSALTSLTTTICVDLLNIKEMDINKAKTIRMKVHVLVSILFLLMILVIDAIGEGSVLNTIYKAASYTYGPLLGLFFFGLFTKIRIKDKFVPVVCVLAPLMCYLVEFILLHCYGYAVGYEILLLNGLLTALGLFLLKTSEKK